MLLHPFIYNYLRHQAEEILLKEQRRYQKVLGELAKQMLRVRDLDELAKSVVLKLFETTQTSLAGIYLKDEEYGKFRLKYFLPQEEKRLPEFIPSEEELIKALSDQKKPLLYEEKSLGGKISLSSGLVIPCFTSETELIGFLLLGPKPQHKSYNPDELLVFETFSYSISLAIENCRFWKEIETRQRQARLQEMDVYSYSLAHEIDNPVQVILGETGFLKELFLKEVNIPAEKQKEAEQIITFILESAKRISGMVKAIRDFGSPATGELKPLKLEETVDKFHLLYSPRFKEEKVIFEKRISPDLGWIRGEEPELMQVFAILANNSLYAMKNSFQKKIILAVEKPSLDLIRITFSDTGTGIKKDFLPLVFSAFTTTKASSEGTGMGLYNAKKIILRHKGKIWAESEGEDKGATFFIELPVANDVTEEELRKEDKSRRIF